MASTSGRGTSRARPTSRMAARAPSVPKAVSYTHLDVYKRQVLWAVTGSESRRTTIHLHTTQLISGALFVLLGLLMLEGQMGLVNGALVRWSAVVDERMLQLQDALLSGLSR